MKRVTNHWQVEKKVLGTWMPVIGVTTRRSLDEILRWVKYSSDEYRVMENTLTTDVKKIYHKKKGRK